MSFTDVTRGVRARAAPTEPGSGWNSLFWHAFRHSRNAMVLVDDQRRLVDVNGSYLRLVGHRRQELLGRPFWELVEHGPQMTPDQWRAALARPQFTGVVNLVCADGGCVTVEFAGHPEVVTGRQLVLGVALRTARAGRRVVDVSTEPPPESTADLSKREQEVVKLLSLGANGPEIADELHVAYNTVRTHVRNAMTKKGARSHAHLVAMSLAGGSALN